MIGGFAVCSRIAVSIVVFATITNPCSALDETVREVLGKYFPRTCEKHKSGGYKYDEDKVTDIIATQIRQKPQEGVIHKLVTVLVIKSENLDPAWGVFSENVLSHLYNNFVAQAHGIFMHYSLTGEELFTEIIGMCVDSPSQEIIRSEWRKLKNSQITFYKKEFILCAGTILKHSNFLAIKILQRYFKMKLRESYPSQYPIEYWNHLEKQNQLKEEKFMRNLRNSMEKPQPHNDPWDTIKFMEPNNPGDFRLPQKYYDSVLWHQFRKTLYDQGPGPINLF
ncbi:hypothetical protein HOD08_03620 [bacterium]|nr:hypothetical protein [bacterium]